MANHEIGSIWRRWDLQVHTPHSHLNQQFGQDFDAYAKELFTRALQSNISVVGVTDYFTIEGYKALREILADDQRLLSICDGQEELAERIREITFFPNIEFRLSTLVNESRVNLHVIFSDEVSPEDIEENFLHEIDCLYEGNPQDRDTTLKLKIRNLETLGERLKREHEVFRDRSDIVIGMMNAVVDHIQIPDLLQSKKSLFDGKYVIGVPSDEDLSQLSWDGQSHHVRKVIIQKADFLFASNPNTIDWALGRKATSPGHHEREFKGLKPCFNSSDAHGFDDMFEPSGKRYTWVKADPTFNGLRQVLNEPADRVFVGEEPEIFARVRNNRTKYIKSVTVGRTDQATLDELWFQMTINFNPGLVAIIGNKGGGKSALADILGLAGNSGLEGHFSFLNGEKFRQRKNNKASHFECHLTWASDEALPRNLGENVDPGDIERVKYIPQSYLEKICSDIGTVSETGFSAELESAIFSGLDESEKLGHSSLQELIKYSSEEIRRTISQLKSEMEDDIDRLVACEERRDPAYRKALEKRIKQKQLELKAAQESQPKEVPKPPEADKNTDLVRKIDQATLRRKECAQALSAIVSAKATTVKKSAIAAKLETAATNLVNHFEYARAEMTPYCDDIGVSFDDIFTFEMKNQKIKARVNKLQEELREIEKQLDGAVDGSATHQLAIAEEELKKAQEELDGPQRLYQEYLKEKEEWERRCNEIKGDVDTPESLVYLQAKERQLKNVEKDTAEARAACVAKSLKIFKTIEGLKGIYEGLHRPIQESVDRHELVKDNLIFAVSVSATTFYEAFLNNINQRKKGTFSGVEEGSARLRKMMEESSFESEEGVRTFLERILDALAFNRSIEGEHDEPMTPAAQLKSGAVTLRQLFEYVFGFDYLIPQYSLLWQGKQIDQLSPGERGTLLLIFYLLVDRDNKPLIIDQPEENLDNQTVFGVLVPAIKEAKSRRQIILVTHNPNLAVVCDAEQVIYANIDKENGNAVSYTSGAIENPILNNHVLDVLEGTRPAFHNRDSKYRPFQGQT